MQKPFEIYIQQQIDAARAEEERKINDVLAEVEKDAATRRAKSLVNTIRALALLGIEVGESDLEYSQLGYSLTVNGIRLALDNNGTDRGANWLIEHDCQPASFERQKQPYRQTKFRLHIHRIVPEEFYSEDGECSPLFAYEELARTHEVTILSDYKTPASPVSGEGILKIFQHMHDVEANFQSALTLYNAMQKSPVAQPKAPQFTYTGDSREEILAHVLRDIQADYYPEVEF